MKNTNNGTQSEPYLRLDINYGNLVGLSAESSGPSGDDLKIFQAVKQAGYSGVQCDKIDICRQVGLRATTSARVNQVGEIDGLAARWVDEGYDCATLHVAWGLETDEEMCRLVEDIVDASGRHSFPLYIETHRATLTQDIWRTIKLVEKIPDVRFNGDFSHWYTGHEMTYGDIESKFDLVQPVFERVRFIHGRIGESGCIQTNIGDGKGRANVEHFREMWTRSMAGFLKSAQRGDFFCFTPELLPPPAYARCIPNSQGDLVEESDRWEQALVLCRIARECFEAAKHRLKT